MYIKHYGHSFKAAVSQILTIFVDILFYLIHVRYFT